MNKRVISIIMIVIALILILVGVFYFKNPYSKQLEQIVEKFNKSSIVNTYKQADSQISATSDSERINIVLINNSGVKNEFAMILDGSILSLNIDSNDKLVFDKLFVAMEIFDIVGQLQGYEEGDLSRTLNSEKVESYTLEKEGMEIKTTSSKYELKIDLSKKVPIIDFSDAYIEVSDLENYKEFISGDGSAEKSKGNVWFNKSGYDGKYTLLVAEYKRLTTNTYKTILSVLEVMFDNSKVIDYFKTNYSDISITEKSFVGFDIIVNPKDKTEWEENLIPSDSGYQFVRITIDKEVVIQNAL